MKAICVETQLLSPGELMAEQPLPAYEGDGPYVFVSHSHDDKTVARDPIVGNNYSENDKPVRPRFTFVLTS